MSEVISLRLGKENPRESKVNEILNAWFEKGFCTRNILTMALLEFDHPDSDLEPGPRIIYSPLFSCVMNHYLMLLRLRDISRNNLIQKAKVYLAGRQPPAGVKVHLGPRGKPYYMSEDLKALKESKKKDKPKEESGEKKKRLPAFKEGNYDNLIHRTKTGEYGPGTYEIKRFSQGGKHIYSLSFSSSVDPSKSNHIATSNEIYSEKGSREHKEAIKHLKT